MKMRIASTVLLCLLFAAFAFASPRQQDEPKAKDASPAMERQDKPEAKPETREQKPDEMKPEKNEQEKQESKDAKEQEKENKDQEKQEEKKSGKDKDMGNMRNENHANARPAGKGGHIPDEKFRASFGRGHTFHPSRPTIVNNQPTFVYGGYSFIMVDPWPVGWAYSDDCYIDYVDGEYFLFDVRHPEVRIALFVSL
jgi:superfamily II DNA/RNA helicase